MMMMMMMSTRKSREGSHNYKSEIAVNELIFKIRILQDKMFLNVKKIIN